MRLPVTPLGGGQFYDPGGEAIDDGPDEEERCRPGSTIRRRHRHDAFHCLDDLVFRAAGGWFRRWIPRLHAATAIGVRSTSDARRGWFQFSLNTPSAIWRRRRRASSAYGEFRNHRFTSLCRSGPPCRLTRSFQRHRGMGRSRPTLDLRVNARSRFPFPHGKR